MLATDVPSPFSFDHLCTFSCQLAQQSLNLFATSDRFLLGDDLGDGDCEIASFLDGVFGVLGDFVFFGEAAAILDGDADEDWVPIVCR